MNETAVAAAAPASSSSDAPDERLAHRGPIQTLLTRPEIGALLGAAGVWLLFWLVSAPFGTVGGTANFLDVAAILGLMAVPVALLMIGGEFDLSSGSMTGAAAIAVILLSSDTGALGGAGLSLHLAVPLSLAFALSIGWFNGTLVEKTSLPSFIVTLGTFFILIGAKLGFAKLFTNKVIVEGLDEAQAYDFWNNIFGAEWVRNGHIWDSRDWAWAGLLIMGGVALLLGILELTYQRSKTKNVAGIVLGIIGAATAVLGLVVLLQLNGSNWDRTGGLIIAVGGLVGSIGWCLARYERRQHSAAVASSEDGIWRRAGKCFIGGFLAVGRGLLAVGRGLWALRHRPWATAISYFRAAISFFWAGKHFIGGLLAVVAAMVIAAIMDSSDSSQLGFLGGGLGRFVLVVGIGATGVLAVLAVLGRVSERYAAIGAGVAMVPALSYMMTVQAARATLFGGLALAGIVLLTLGANKLAHRAEVVAVVSLATSVAVVLLAFFIQSQSDESRKIRVELFTALLLLALVIAVLAVPRFLSARRVTAPPTSAGLESWTRIGAIAGGVAALISLVIELFVDGDGILYSISISIVKGGLVAFGVYAVGTVFRLLFTRDESIGRSVVIVGLAAVMLGVATRLLFITSVEAEATRATTQFGVGVLFFLIFAAVGAWVLVRTQFGSWIFAVGGNKEAARSIGVPAARTKTTLFMLVSSAAWLTGMVIAFRLNSVQANVGDGNEFRYIIVAVVGGNLLTGGYGSALGAAIGALIWGMIQQGIGFATWNSDWRFLVLGALLLVAVLVNNYVRGRAEKAR